LNSLLLFVFDDSENPLGGDMGLFLLLGFSYCIFSPAFLSVLFSFLWFDYFKKLKLSSDGF